MANLAPPEEKKSEYITKKKTKRKKALHLD
jgi:hypothetical protein